MEWRDGFWYTRCAYSDCRAPMAFEDGKSTVMCPTCHRVIQIQPTGEELRQKEAKAEKLETVEKPAEEKPEVTKEEAQEEKPSGGAGEPEEKPEKAPDAEAAETTQAQ